MNDAEEEEEEDKEEGEEGKEDEVVCKEEETGKEE